MAGRNQALRGRRLVTAALAVAAALAAGTGAALFIRHTAEPVSPPPSTTAMAVAPVAATPPPPPPPAPCTRLTARPLRRARGVPT